MTPSRDSRPMRDSGALADLGTNARIEAVYEASEEVLAQLERVGRNAVVILGPRGMGKSHHLRALRTESLRRGFSVVELHPHAAQVPLLEIALLCERLGGKEIGGLTDVAMAISRVRQILKSGSMRARRWMLLVDDLHLFPAPDLAVLEDLITLPVPNGPQFVIATRAGTAGHAGALVHRITSDLRVPVVVLEPLSEERLAVLAENLLQERISPQFLQDFHRLTGGIPGYVADLMHEIRRLPSADRGQLAMGVTPLDDFPLPRSIQNAILAEMEGLGTGAKRALQILAFWEMPASLHELRELEGPDGARSETVLADLEATGLVRAGWAEGDPELRFEIVDRMIARVIREATPLLESMRLHQRAGSLISQRRGSLDPEQLLRLVWHYLRGGLPTSLEESAGILQSARYLNSQNRFAAARDLLRAALSRSSLGRDPGLIAEANELLAHAYAHLGRLSEAERLLMPYRTHPPQGVDPETRNRLLWRLARTHLASGDDESAVSAFHMVLQDPGPISSMLRQQVLRDLATFLHNDGQPEAALEISRSAVDEAVAAGEYELAAYAITRLGIILTSMGSAEQALQEQRYALQLARKAGSRQARIRVIGNMGNSRADLGDLEGGLRRLKYAIEGSRAVQDFAAVEVYARSSVHIERELGRWDQALEHGVLGELVNRKFHRNRSQRRARAAAETIRVLRGDIETLPAYPELADEEDAARPDMWHLGVLADREIAAGAWREALRIVEMMESILLASPGHDRWLYRDVLPRKAAVLTELGDADALDAMVTDYERFRAATRDTQPFIAIQAGMVRGLAELVRGDWVEAVDYLGRAVREFDERKHVWRAALARRHYAIALSHVGSRDVAASELKNAFTALSTMGASPEAERIGAELRALNRRPPALRRRSQGVTAREWDVIELACEGKTDKEIAEIFWLSTRTVSTHIHNILAKLGLRSRFELQAWVDANQAARPPGTSRGAPR